MPRSTRAAILRSLRNLTRAQRELEALLALAPPGRRLLVSYGVRRRVVALDDSLDTHVRELVMERRRQAVELLATQRELADRWRQEAQRALTDPDAARRIALRRLEDPAAAPH